MSGRSETIVRCAWCEGQFPAYREYHDKEWGVPVRDDRTHFEFLVLEGAQAGLSWATVLKKRAHYRKVFDHFDPEKVARYNDAKINQLLHDAGIIRNKMKVKSAVTNACAFLDIQAAYGSFDKYIWAFIGGKPIQNDWETMEEVPSRTELSDALSKDLKARNFNFVGSTIVYAHMQATGLVNDHVISCFRHEACRKMGQNMFSL